MPDILIATDAASVHDEIRSVVAEPGTTIRWIRRGEAVRDAMNLEPADLAIVDSQIGTMGGIAVTLVHTRVPGWLHAGRTERDRVDSLSGSGRHRKVLLVLDRRPDVFMARRSGAEGWIVKPLDPIRLRKAVAALLAGGTWHDTSFLPEPVAVPVK